MITETAQDSPRLSKGSLSRAQVHLEPIDFRRRGNPAKTASLAR
jgi:hypothetical protein